MHGTDAPRGKRGAAYIRVSDGEKQDPQRQRDTITAWASNRRLSVSRYYPDVDGRNPRAKAECRVQFQALLADVKAGKWDWIVVDSQERFGTKDAFEFGYFAHILRIHGCQLWSVSQGHLTADDLATPIITSLHAGSSREELLKLGRRNVSGKRVKAANGEWQGGYVPYGYDVVCVGPDGKEKFRVVIEDMRPTEGVWKRVRTYPDGGEERFDGDDIFPVKERQDRFLLAPSRRAERVAIAREIFQMYADGAWTLRGLCQRLNDRHISPVYGDGWYVSKLTPMLRNPAYYIGQTVWGKVSHGYYAQYVGGEYVEPQKVGGKVKSGRRNDVADWIFPHPTDAIITRELWDAVQAKLASVGTRKRGLRNPDLWLAGLLYCDRCGLRMTGWTQKGEPSYVCETFRKYGHTPANKTGCRLHRTQQNVLEGYVLRYVEEVAPQVLAFLEASSQPSLVAGSTARMDGLGDEIHDTLCRMADVVERAGYGGKDDNLFEGYRDWLEGERPLVLAGIARKREEVAKLVERFTMLPKNARAALDAASAKMEALQAELDDLEAQAEPLTERFDALVSQMRELGVSLRQSDEALKGDDARRKAEAVRRVINKVVLRFRHYEHKPTDRRSRNDSIPKSRLEEVEVHPCVGSVKVLPRTQVIGTCNPPARG